MNVLIILGHPRKDSFCGALSEAYREGAVQAKVNVRQLVLADMEFDPHVRTVSPRQQFFEQDIRRAQAWIEWADHLVFVYPAWWGTMPALLKGFLDRVLTPEFAFAECGGGSGFKPLLPGKSAQLITTMDTPPWVYRFIYKRPGYYAMQRATLGFCGLKPVRILVCGPVKDSSLAQRKKWLEKARQEGLKLQEGIVKPWEHLRDKAIAWLKAIRLQFYPMTWVAYTVGALGAALQTGVFASNIYWLGYLCLFFLEVATVLTNEVVDFESDQQNEYFSALTGGSRVLVEKQLSFKEVRTGIFAALVLTLVFAGLILQNTADAVSSGFVLLGMSILALGYTMPPLKLVYRGLGELDVGITHSLAAILCGYAFQGGALSDPFPWLLGMPLFLAVLPSITLAGIPDYEADKAVSKNTLAVLIGPKRAAVFAMGTTVLAAVTAVVWHYLGLAEGAFTGAAYFILPHAGFLLVLLYRYLQQSTPPARIDGLLVASLTYIIWFGAIPLFNLI